MPLQSSMNPNSTKTENLLDVSVIVVSYNTRSCLKICLDSVYQQTAGVSFEVIVVDNASSDCSPEMITAEFPSAIFIQNETNVGFGAACNIGFARANGKYLFLLNPDAILLDNVIATLFSIMERHSSNDRIGAAGCILTDSSGKSAISYGRFLNFGDEIWPRLRGIAGKLLGSRTKGRFRRSMMTDFGDRGMFAVDYVTGADLFLSRSALEDAGTFDSDYFMYAEEMDLQYRMMLLGYKRVIVEGPKLTHDQGASFNGSRDRAVMMTIGKLLFARKHYRATRYRLLKFLMLGIFFFERSLDAHDGTGSLDDSWALTMRCWKEDYPR